MPRNMPRKQAGFTLVEIAIVLVIIGLLLGGVLKGQELIQSAKIKNVVNDFNSISAAIYGYQDRYKMLPGDDTGTARWATAVPVATYDFATNKGDGNGLIKLNDNSAFCEFTSNTLPEECATIWADLRQAGFITGGLTSGPPQNAYNGILGVRTGNDAMQSAAGAGTGFKGVIICESNIPDKAAIALDNQLDDGNPSTGSLRAIKQLTPSGAVTAALMDGVKADAAYVEDNVTYYTVCKTLQ